MTDLHRGPVQQTPDTSQSKTVIDSNGRVSPPQTNDSPAVKGGHVQAGKEEKKDAKDDPSKETEGKTWTLQHKLPKLPVPKLEDSCKRYLRSLEGLQVSKQRCIVPAIPVVDHAASPISCIGPRRARHHQGCSSRVPLLW